MVKIPKFEFKQTTKSFESVYLFGIAFSATIKLNSNCSNIVNENVPFVGVWCRKEHINGGAHTHGILIAISFPFSRTIVHFWMEKESDLCVEIVVRTCTFFTRRDVQYLQIGQQKTEWNVCVRVLDFHNFLLFSLFLFRLNYWHVPWNWPDTLDSIVCPINWSTKAFKMVSHSTSCASVCSIAIIQVQSNMAMN